MKNYFYSIKLIFILASLVSVTSCDSDDENECCDPSNPECSNYDPCYGSNPTSADFKFLDELGFGSEMEWREEPFFYGGNIKFSAVDQDADSYTWYLGVDTFTNVSEKTLNIGDLPNGTYGASLVVEKTPNNGCFPNDTGRDSLYQTFTKIDYCDVLVFGKFRGVKNQEQDSIDIEIINADPNSGVPCPASGGYIFSVNLLNNGDTILAPSGPFSYSKLFIDGSGSGDPKGVMTINLENSIVNFTYRLNNIDHSFIGRKLN